jgi:hypothetical protein
MKHRHQFTPDTLNIHHMPTGMAERIARGVVKTMQVFSRSGSSQNAMGIAQWCLKPSRQF